MESNRITRKHNLHKRKRSAEKCDTTAAEPRSIEKKKKKKINRNKKRAAETVNNLDVIETSKDSDIDSIILVTKAQIHNIYEQPAASPSLQDDPDNELHEPNGAVSLLRSPEIYQEDQSAQNDIQSPVHPQNRRELYYNDRSAIGNMSRNAHAELSSTENQFIGNAWKTEVNKDIKILFKETGKLVKSLKEIKHLLREGNTRRSRSSSYSTSDEEIKFAMLPEFKLKKVTQVREMETNINENRTYKRQLIKKMATFGGRTTKDCVINIFKGMFTKKLGTKMCWTGTSKKEEFRQFSGLRHAIRRAVKSRIRNVSLADVDNECKLRFNQAQKDYDREKAKKAKFRE